MEKFSKKGRPALMSEEAQKLFKNLNPFRCNRSLQNRYYFSIAFNRLGGTEGLQANFSWLAEEKPEGDLKRITLFYELGRLPNEEITKEIASILCELKPRVRDGILIIKRIAGKEQAAGSTDKLIEEIFTTIENYEKRYQCSQEQIIGALRMCLFVIGNANKTL